MSIISCNEKGEIVTQKVDSIESKKDLIKRMYCKAASDDELEMFLMACKRTGLDPFMKQIYAIKRGNTMTIQTGIDGFRLIAERTGNYSPGKEPAFTYDEKGKVLSATAYIKKRTSDNVWHEVASTAYMEEYNANQGLWSKMPRTMLAKCAEALALRRAFPAELSGLYTADEMGQSNNAEANIPHIERDERLDEEQICRIKAAMEKIDDGEFIARLDGYIEQLGKKNIFEINQKHFSKIIKHIENKAKEKDELNGQETVA